VNKLNFILVIYNYDKNILLNQLFVWASM